MAFLLHPNNTASDRDSPATVTVEGHQNENLLIFGYHCKLFRDDDKALEIDAGAHLIPWMGDESLKIDRYDGRGHLFDLEPYDADNVRDRELSSEEIRIERLCEEERYLELHTDLAEKAIQEEEEIKRLNMELAESGGYQAVGFSYDQPSATATSDAPSGNTTPKDEEDDDLEFIPPAELCLPAAMTYPKGTKLNSLIEKTAKFVSSHGGQMEIMIKTKQSNNPQFQFLNFEHHLNPYYKHQVYMIKNGRYNPDIHNKPPPPPPNTMDSSNDSDDEGDSSGYLHPSLLAAKTAPSTNQSELTSLPHVQYTQSQLENTSYGRLLKKISINQPLMSNSPQRISTPTFSDTDSNSQPVASEGAVSATTHQYAHTGEATEANGYSYSADAAAYYSHYYNTYEMEPASSRPPSPPADVKPLIDRLISYVKKDGEAFEKQVLSRQDDRFSFLQPGSDYYDYYVWRKHVELGLVEDNSKSKGVSFSIKQKEPETSSISASRVALPVDPESDDEDGSSTADGSHPSHSAQTSNSAAVTVPQSNNSSRVEEKPPLSEESVQKKIAEQKLRDKLAAAAREKMTQVTQNTKDKSLQAERKRKAAMFVTMLKSKQKSSAGAPSAPTSGQELPPPDPHRLSSRGNSSHSQRRDHHSDVSYRLHDNQHHSHSRSRSRSPPSAYSVKVNRSRESHSRSSRHNDSYSSSGSRHNDTSNSSRHSGRRRADDRSYHSRRRRSTSPTHSSKTKSKHKVSQSTDSVNRELMPGLGTSLNPPIPEAYAREAAEAAISLPQAAISSPQAADSREFMLKVRKMLKENRQAVYKEDMFGN